MQALIQNETQELVPKPKDVKPISCKWLYKLKVRPDDSIKRYKAQLVARGFLQTYGIVLKKHSVQWQKSPMYVFYWHWPPSSLGDYG